MKNLAGFFLLSFLVTNLAMANGWTCKPDEEFVRQDAGIADGFVSPGEPAYPSTGLSAARPGAFRQFDQGGSNRRLVHTFWVPANTVVTRAQLETTVGTPGDNDNLELLFTSRLGSNPWTYFDNGTQSHPPIQTGETPRYGVRLNALAQGGGTITLDLSNLPPTGNIGNSSVIEAMNKAGRLDFHIQDDTNVDYAILKMCVRQAECNSDDGECGPNGKTLSSGRISLPYPQVSDCSQAEAYLSQSNLMQEFRQVYLQCQTRGSNQAQLAKTAHFLDLVRCAGGGNSGVDVVFQYCCSDITPQLMQARPRD